MHEAQLLRPYCSTVDLPRLHKLALPNRPIEAVYFIESGIVLVVGTLRDVLPLEVGIAGREGVANLAALLGVERAPYECVVQVPGRAVRVAADAARVAVETSRSFNFLVRQYAHVFMNQLALGALARGRGSVPQRLARWLLVVHDRLDADSIPVTHDLLALMVGVRRPAVTLGLRAFEAQGLVARRRGILTLRDRAALLEVAGPFYTCPDAEQLLPLAPSSARGGQP